MSVINTNYLSLVAQNNLNKTQSAFGTAIERLSSGLRINSAKDDAAGQAISNRFTSNIKGLTQANRNAQNDITIMQTADGVLNEGMSHLVRVQELLTQGANMNDVDREGLQNEIDSLLNSFDSIMNDSKVNGIQLFSEDKELVTSIGGEQGTIALSKYDTETLNLSDLSVSSTKQAEEGMKLVKDAMDQINEKRSSIGAMNNRLIDEVSNFNNSLSNLSASKSRINDKDYAAEVANMTRSQILQQAGTSILAQANSIPQTALSLLR